MKRIYAAIMVASCSLLGFVASAQKENVGIGTTKPDQSAILDLSSSTKGLLMPRLSLQQRSAIQNPANGLIVYQTDMLSGFYFYDGKEWKPLTSATEQNSVASDPNDWSFGGNLPGAGSFVGTQAGGIDLEFKVNGLRAGLLANASGNSFYGYRSGEFATGTYNTGIGQGSLRNVSGADNIGVGVNSLIANTTGGFNTGIGNFALATNTIGSFNMAIGAEALQTFNPAVAGSGYNTAIGKAALKSNMTGTDNTGIGVNSLRLLTSGTFNMALGGFALENTNGNFNTGIGNFALNSNTTGSGNVGIGAYALAVKGAAGDNNTAIGAYAGRYLAAGQSGNIFIGYQAGQDETASNKLYIANNNTTTPLIYGDFTAKYLAVGEVSVADRAAATTGGYKLLVKGGMMTEKIKVATAGTLDWADYVFDNDYKVMPLDAVEAFVKENKHLPNVPSTEEMMKNGNDLGKTDAKLLEKIEELTLYMIEMNKEVKALKAENQELKKAIKK